MSAPHLEPANFLTIVKRVLAFFSAFSMWGFHVSRLSKVMPRYVGLSSCFKHYSFILSTTSFWLGERLNTEYVVLSAFSLTIHLFVHSHKTSSACCILCFATKMLSSVRHRTRSSAYIAPCILGCISFIMSLMYIRNSFGLRTPPWGTSSLSVFFLL